MAYKKPQIVAKGVDKQSFVAWCPDKERFQTAKCDIPSKK